ncbi:30S ribosome-binding factor RbfA [Oceaniovalibus sp. ACAM 378]|jgi:ribosome-binding factor A|uniref:30S ribosome-binding factor RbfA n=1 Tax=Oceaniovalibus sp. ACAM 378 TaxID=2599923 RepID=UPI0011D65F02|nr:30S ribosome-binding factor RbfA [Oceaniovalibus sp. ACAM 378]TYB86348.1 30S ribosome-binding factor RbfA [Oceaniovalibus sp. ACAM 378]
MAKNRFTSDSGPSNRQLRVGELIRRTLSDILMKGGIHDSDLNQRSITVSEVRTSPDLRVATVFVLPLGGQDQPGAIAALKRNKGEIRRLLGREITLRNVPELRYLIDDTFDRMDQTRELLNRENVRRDLDNDTPDES